MKDVVKSPGLKDCFRLFSVGEMAGENFLFWEAVQDFSGVDEEEHRRDKFSKIYETFLNQDCDLEINLSGMSYHLCCYCFPLSH